jgi:hypothetical protein
MTMVSLKYGKSTYKFEWDAVRDMMDRQLRILAFGRRSGTPQQITDRYVDLHREKYDHDFVLSFAVQRVETI